jgi:GNAT superfamily N-acetyltransferase
MEEQGEEEDEEEDEEESEEEREHEAGEVDEYNEALLVSLEEEPALCGIAVVWVQRRHRRKGIGEQCVRVCTCVKEGVEVKEVRQEERVRMTSSEFFLRSISAFASCTRVLGLQSRDSRAAFLVCLFAGLVCWTHTQAQHTHTTHTNTHTWHLSLLE